MSEQIDIRKYRIPRIDPAILIHLQYLSERMKEHDIDVEFATETRVTLKPRKEKKIYTDINNEHFIHMLIQDSHKIAKKIREDFEIKEGEEANIDSFLVEYWDENEDSSEVIRRIREDI